MSSSSPWWRQAVVYQVYLRSFADGNGDGTGDIAGLRSRLGYVRSLGVDAIWINPWYQSPLRDGGYDVADYRKIHPLFGTLEEAEVLIGEARNMGLHMILDLVPNHTSSEHTWFQEALGAPPGSAPRGRYHFLAGEGRPPNDWRSVFGGSAWTRVPDGEWYLHLFDQSQPDLNWASAEVREEFGEIIRFWLDRAASGFRVDVAHGLAKASDYHDVGGEEEDLLAPAKEMPDHPFWDRPELHEIVREWRKLVDEYPETMMVAEAWVASWERLAGYVRPDEYHQAFDFLFLRSPWSRDAMMERITEAVTAAKSVGSIPTWVLSNHDVVRHSTRYGLPQDVEPKHWLLHGDRSLLDEELGLRRARAAILLMLALPGSVYLYQGEELGLPEVHDLPFEVLDDPVWERSGHTMKGRDGCRVPIPWSSDEEWFGFGSSGSWLPQPPTWKHYAVDVQEGVEGSTLELYRKAIRLRSDHLRGDEELHWLHLGERVLAFSRGSGVVCAVNFGAEPVGLPRGRVLVRSVPFEGSALPPDTAVWVLVD